MGQAHAGRSCNPAQTRVGPPERTGTFRPRTREGVELRAAAQQEGGGTVSNQHNDNSQQLGDFTTTARVIPLSLLAIGIGVLSTFVAWALLRLIALFTNIFYYGRLSTVF